MNFYRICVILTCLMQVIGGLRVPLLAVCNSVCSVQQDGSFFSTICQTEDPVHQTTLHSVKQTSLHTSDQTSLHTIEQSSLHTADQTSLNTVEQSSLHTADQTSLYTADQTSLNTVEQSSLHTADQTSLYTADQSSLHTADRTSLHTADQTSLYTADQSSLHTADRTSLHIADQTSLHTADPTSNHTENNMTKRNSLEGPLTGTNSFLGKTIYATFSRGTYSFTIKTSKWKMLTYNKLYNLCADPIGHRVLGRMKTSIISLEGHRKHIILEYKNILKRIKHLDYEVNTKEVFVVDNRFRIIRTKTALPKLTATKEINGLKLDQKNRILYVITREIEYVKVVALSYGGTLLKSFHLGRHHMRFLGHFDHIDNRVLVTSQKIRSPKSLFIPGMTNPSSPTGLAADIDYDEENVYVLDKTARLSRRKRGETAMTYFGKIRRNTLGFSIAII